MYQRIKENVLNAIYLALLLRFALLMVDPTVQGQVATGAFAHWQGATHIIYTVTAWIMFPVQGLYNILASLVPALHNAWFPTMPSVVIGENLQKIVFLTNPLPWPPGLKNNGFLQMFPGVFDWLSLVTIIFYGLVSPWVDALADFFRNFVWNLLIEFSFTKKKQDLYQEALKRRAEELTKLNVEYRNLSHEAVKLKDSVVTDELTQVYNKRFFLDRINQEYTQARQRSGLLSLIMVDIDYFKKLNDTYGHLTGDRVLHLVAQEAKKATPTNCYCCRFGGEEFSIILPGRPQQEALFVANTIKDSVPLLRFPKDDPNLSVTVSMGVCTVNFKSPNAESVKDLDAFTQLADNELYRAKLEGRNRVCATQVD